MSSEAVLERPGFFSDNVSSATGRRSSQVPDTKRLASAHVVSVPPPTCSFIECLFLSRGLPSVLGFYEMVMRVCVCVEC